MRVWIILLAIFLVIVVGGLVGWLVGLDAGYVLISYDIYLLETSLWVGLGLLLALYLLIRGVVWTVRAVLTSQVVVGRWRSRRALKAARQQTVRGLLLMAEGRWEEAKKTFLKGIGFAETPLINYLNAARAAHEMGLAEERDNYLKRAHETTPGAKFAALLTQAEFQVQEGHFENALRLAANPEVYAELGRLCVALGDERRGTDYLLKAQSGLPDLQLPKAPLIR